MIQNKQIQQINTLLQHQLVKKFGIMAIAFMVVGSVAYFGTHQKQGSHAATGSALTMSTSSIPYSTGSSIAVTLYEDSLTDTVNSVQASVTYDPTKLQYVSMAEGTAFPVIAATSTGTAGTIRIGRATPSTNPVSGKNSIVTLTFKVVGSSGTTQVAYDPSFSYIVRSTDNVNVLAAVAGANYNMKLPEPALLTVSPASGSTAGGTIVTLTGGNYQSGATVTIGGTLATGVTYVNATTLTAIVAAHSYGVVTVIVTNPDGQTATKPSGFTYLADAPTIGTISPAIGSTSGGTQITVTGTNFMNGAIVSVGGIAVSNITVVSATSITATTPAHAAGASLVVVTNPDGGSNSNQPGFTYQIPLPIVSSISPTSGSTAGGTAVTITGSNFVGVTGVAFDTVPAIKFVVVNPTTITATAPAHAAGLSAVSVTNTTGLNGLKLAFTYQSASPTVTTISPSLGTANGGTVVTITGTNFVSSSQVTIGGLVAPSVTYVSPTTLTAQTPAHAAGLATITVTNPGDTQAGSLTNGFIFLGLGDANNDGRINAVDLSILISHDGQNYAAADFNGDGTVGAADMAILLGRWTW